MEVLGCAFTCFNASQYAALLLVDSEAEYGPLEARKLRHDIIHFGLSVVVVADWYSPAVMKSLRLLTYLLT